MIFTTFQVCEQCTIYYTGRIYQVNNDLFTYIGILACLVNMMFPWHTKKDTLKNTDTYNNDTYMDMWVDCSLTLNMEGSYSKDKYCK